MHERITKEAPPQLRPFNEGHHDGQWRSARACEHTGSASCNVANHSARSPFNRPRIASGIFNVNVYYAVARTSKAAMPPQSGP